MSQVKITLVRSVIGSNKAQRSTVSALGLKKTNSSIIKEVSAPVMGMIVKVRHLLKVEEVK